MNVASIIKYFCRQCLKLIFGERKEICLEQDMVLHEHCRGGLSLQRGNLGIVSAHM